jgi:hypothetical protein
MLIGWQVEIRQAAFLGLQGPLNKIEAIVQIRMLNRGVAL